MASQRFISSLTSDPLHARIISVFYPSALSQHKADLLSKSLLNHSADSLEATAFFLQYNGVQKSDSLKKSITTAVYKRLRYWEPDSYTHWITDMNEHLDEALELRRVLKNNQQTYKAVCDIIGGLSNYAGHEQFTKAQKSCLITAVYVHMQGVEYGEGLDYNWRGHWVRLTNGELLEYILEYPEAANSIRKHMVEKMIVRPAEIEAAMNGANGSLIKGSL